MKFTILGSGTPAPSLQRQSSGYIAEIGDDLIVFDHGGGAHQRLLEAGYRAQDVTHLFLTHYHYDHTLDVPRLVLTRWDHGAPGQGALNVYGPPPLQRFMDGFFSASGAFSMDINARIKSPASQAVYAVRGGEGARPGPALQQQEVNVGDIITGNDWRISVGPTRHVQPELNCIAYRIETAAGTIVYSGDNGGVYEPFIEFCRDADVLIHMNHFLTGSELNNEYRLMSGSHLDNAETARLAGVKTLVLTHLQPNFDQPGVVEKMLAEMSTVFDGSIIVGRDLRQLPLHPPSSQTAA